MILMREITCRKTSSSATFLPQVTHDLAWDEHRLPRREAGDQLPEPWHNQRVQYVCC
jgi:hypothetical protein